MVEPADAVIHPTARPRIYCTRKICGSGYSPFFAGTFRAAFLAGVVLLDPTGDRPTALRRHSSVMYYVVALRMLALVFTVATYGPTS